MPTDGKMVNAKQRKRKRDKTVSAAIVGQSSKKLSTDQHRPVVPSEAAMTQSTCHKKFLAASDGAAYLTLMRDHYQGFALVPAAQVQPASFHVASKLALEKLRDAGYYQYDMVMAGGKNLSRTFVQRTLVGEPGITYKYLGLRLFAHAWSGAETTDHFRNIYAMNQEMIRMTKDQLRYHGRTGCCDYNLTLINFMEPSCDTVLREEESYGMGKASVSWHADSSLQDFSSIGVYHTLPTQKASTWDWKIALRENPDEESGRPAAVQPVVVPTKSGDVYFLLGDFNHTHQHMVLAGSTARRISSTHRVAVTETDTYNYIRDRCSMALTSVKAELKEKESPADWNIPILMEAQAVLTEVEFEWIAQYWVQGAQHNVQHIWWQAPVRALEQARAALEKLTFKIYTRCTTSDGIPRELLLGLVAALKSRKEWRSKWDDRRADKIYKRRISRPFQPVDHPVFTTDACPKRLPKDLTAAVSTLSRVLAELDKKTAGAGQLSPLKGRANEKPDGKFSGASLSSGRRTYQSEHNTKTAKKQRK